MPYKDKAKFAEYMRKYRRKNKVLVIHNDFELWALLCNDDYIWHPESFPKVKFSKEMFERFNLEGVKTE